MKRLQLKAKEERRLLRGHPWAYRSELDPTADLEDGQMVDLYTDGNRFVARGFWQNQGGIAVRILTRRQDAIDSTYWGKRVDAARQLRERLFGDSTTYRWIFGESDGLPGFVADRYGRHVSAASPCAFYRTWADILAERFMREGVEGVRIALPSGILRYGDVPRYAEAEIDGLRLLVDIEAGQKTGMFLDQRVNCRWMHELAKGGTVLDGHCYAGLWACMAGKAGADLVVGVDSSQAAIERAKANAEANGLAGVCQFECCDIEAHLASGATYDVVIIDPPALAKSRAQAAKASTLHQQLHKTALEAVKPGGFLVSSCCSHFVGREAFMESLKRAARSAHRDVCVLQVSGASPDHPVLLSMPETEYLTCVVAHVV